MAANRSRAAANRNRAAPDKDRNTADENSSGRWAGRSSLLSTEVIKTEKQKEALLAFDETLGGTMDTGDGSAGTKKKKKSIKEAIDDILK